MSFVICLSVLAAFTVALILLPSENDRPDPPAPPRPRPEPEPAPRPVDRASREPMIPADPAGPNT